MGFSRADELRRSSEPSRARILIVAGGTGGHIFPALAVAEELQRRSGPGEAPYAIEFVGTHRPLEAKLIPAAGFRLRTVTSAGLKGIHGIQRLRNFLVLPRTAIEVFRILREFKPDVVLGVGGYLAGPVLLEAALMNIPTVLIEPNARPGFTNRMLAPFVRAAAVGFKETEKVFGKKARLTGHPIRQAFLNLPRRDDLAQGSAQSQTLTVLIAGGSLGSKAINDAVVQSLPWVTSENGKVPGGIRIIHQTGERDYNEVRKTYHQKGLVAEVHAFIDDMPATLAQADLVICRSGATTVAELAAAGKAAVMIPFPGATDQHQLENARAFERAGAARVIVQSELTPDRLASDVRHLLVSPAAIQAMETSARSLARPDAAARIADMVEEFTRKSS